MNIAPFLAITAIPDGTLQRLVAHVSDGFILNGGSNKGCGSGLIPH